MPDRLGGERALVDSLVADHAEVWDLAGRIPVGVPRELGAAGLLCAQVPAAFGGLGFTSAENGEFTAHVGSRCSSLRSVMTSQGMAAWTVQRLGDRHQRESLLAELTSGRLAAVGFSEPDAGSDLSGMRTEIRREGDDTVVVDGHKVWMTAACYADLLVVIGRFDGGAAAVVVPASAPGVQVSKVADPLGCRAAGHADVTFERVRLPVSSVLGGVGQSLPLLLTTALAYGRFSVAWGCVGILRACLAATATHAAHRTQSGIPLARHQLVGRHLAELLVDERTAALACERASRCWDRGSPDLVIETVLAKHVSARNAARGAASAVQVLASAGAQDGHVVARAYRDAKLMEIIEGSNEICQLLLAEHAVANAAS
ncbi:acyl-CoA dehydrogenase [Saccharomonospora piscinae]|uniref:acyl-CoA dehydrogenase family protein n=1 Tax=Saccharomonospora piscinae TaxID=687388 RepID=UPI0011065927|nr:acyl-CoA dehydrogenase family protein [Saccharomonospora piscinae]TLW91395.1 acyl-CoA dehydrogenase [Saccharomonospora piscinae]